MDTPNPIIFLFLALFAYGLSIQDAHSNQNLSVATGSNDFYYDSAKNQTFARFAANDPIYNNSTQSVNTARAYNVVGLDGKTYQATIPRTAAADINKVGAAVSRFAQRVGPIGMAIATADLICSTTTLCNQAGVWFFGEEISTVTTLSCASVGSGTVQYASGGYYHRYKIIPKAACGGSVPSGWGITASCSPSIHGCVWGDDMIKESAGSAVQYPSKREATQADWNAQEAAMNTPGFADRLASELEPLPIQKPLPFSPISIPISKSTTTNRDALGNATGTKVTEKKLNISDAATETEPNQAKIEEIETSTDYDLNNQPLSSTETTQEIKTNPEPEPQQDFDLDFDQSEDHQLETFEVPGLFDYTPFGGAGSCPGDSEVSTKFGGLTFSYEPICDTAEGVRPFVILFAIIGAFFIVSGAVRS